MFLNFNDHSVLVSCQGGSILQWQWKEHFLLGPARTERIRDQLRLRGESHWCFPNFGSAPEDVKLPKHGFLRTLVMDPAKVDDYYIDLFQRFGPEEFETWDGEIGVVTRQADHDDLVTTLRVKNTSEQRRGKGMPILPGMHPYFNTEHGGVIIVGGEEVQFDKRKPFGPLVVERRDPICVKFQFGSLYMRPSNNCGWLVLWSDKPASYFCVEPVFLGKPGTFATENHETYLGKGKTARCEVMFTFVPA